ncbi:ribosome small subunit-dependent GTPase A [Bacillus paralicheniformis]|uniref:ribosome small subunit-dependent GTPase A n=1 Tax=Bacillus paralicheniformis TaxID=1648923 RepID=UPI00128DA1EF|nr:ribosome small subunit-dependent GTPase A [Bacillus paralicheniformis]MPQ25244.1 ribosome small subunit-dependent GTPase A [Bacillus paralicheniformis]
MNLSALGIKYIMEALKDEEGLILGRIALEHKRLYRVWTEDGEWLAEISGRLRFEAESRKDYPAVGDWVYMRPHGGEKKGMITEIVPRFSKFSRKAAGEPAEEQITAANVNTIFLVNALGLDFNVRRIERYLLLAWESGANPVIVLSKADIADRIEEKVRQAESVAFGVPIHVISAHEGSGMDELKAYVKQGETVALLGSSGVGKSTIINFFLNEDRQAVQSVREDDDKGRHTTTHREMFLLPEGGLLIDTPGMRALELWESEEGFRQSFSDIDQLAESCRFSDCLHQTEPGCSVQEALADGRLDAGRFQSYLKLKKELEYLERKTDKRAAQQEKKRWKQITKSMKKNKHK